MKTKPHGLIQLSLCGEIILLRMGGSSNLEGARRRTRHLQAFWQASGSPARWGLLVDMRE